MRIENSHTGTTYYTRTAKQFDGFASIVVKQVNKNGLPVSESLVAREVYPTRAKAYNSASKVCKALARNHAYLN
jgi:hypothetical protein